MQVISTQGIIKSYRNKHKTTIKIMQRLFITLQAIHNENNQAIINKIKITIKQQQQIYQLTLNHIQTLTCIFIKHIN